MPQVDKGAAAPPWEARAARAGPQPQDPARPARLIRHTDPTRAHGRLTPDDRRPVTRGSAPDPGGDEGL